MIVDTSETSLGNFGIYLPKLKQLKLNGSHVPRIRDLGTSLVHLKVLWLSRSGLVDLDGIATLNNLRELYLAYNDISDISPCSLLENLTCLDLEGFVKKNTTFYITIKRVFLIFNRFKESY